MSTAWWGKEASRIALPDTAQPLLLMKGGRVFIRQDIAERIPAFTPEWTSLRYGDAGYALLGLHAELAEPLVQRLNLLPQKALIEYLRVAGVSPVPARPARAVLMFTVSDAAPKSVLVPEGFQVSGTAADGSGETVIFETEETLYAAPGAIKQYFIQDGERFFEVDLGGSDAENAEPAFGTNPKPGAGLLLGFNSPIEPRPSVTIHIQLSSNAGAPPPVSQGGIEPQAIVPRPFLRWQFFDGGSFKTAQVIKDETRSLLQSGVIVLRTPRRWRTGTPAGIPADKPLRWLRLAVISGEFQASPKIAFIRLNPVTAMAARTVRNEVPEYIPDTEGRRLRLSQKPVLAGSLKLTVNEGITPPGAQPSAAATGETTASGSVVWHEVADLNAYGPDDRVYELDAAGGELQFGDGTHGAALPRGFRHVVAERYQVATGLAGGVDAEQITSLVSSVPFLVGVNNPLPASGGQDEETLDQTLVRGPQQIRTRKRAVAVADYGLLALTVNGADIRRAHTVAGVHAGYNNAQVPGAVTVFLLGPPRPESPPYPDQGSLDAVSRFLAERYAPAGVEVVAAAPRFHRISVRAAIAIAATADEGDVIRNVLQALDRYFDPISGGDHGGGWPFGGTVHHNAVVRRLLEQVDHLQAVSALNMVIDGNEMPACSDYELAPHALLWPDTHDLRVVEEKNA